MSYQRFYELLKIKNTTVYRVSKETGISASTFSDWKSGRSVPKTEKMRKIADHFDVSLEYLLGDETTAKTSLKQVPIIGEIRAGAPIITNETLLGYECADVDDTDEHFSAIAEMASSLSHILAVEIEPYHPLGNDKYSRLGKSDKAVVFPTPTKDEIDGWIEKISKMTSVKVRKS